MNLKSLLTMFFLLAVSLMASAQVRYIYDPAGNRILREHVSYARSRSQYGDEESDNRSTSDMLANRNIRVYPNPTSGQLKVEVLNFEDTDICDLSLCTLLGIQIASARLTSSHSIFDLSAQKDGLYLLHMQINGIKHSWKILKK